MFPNNKFTLHEMIAISAMCFFILAVALLRYGGMSDQYDIIFWLYKNIGNHTDSIFMHDLMFFESSYFFILNSLLGLNSNENVTLVWYLTATLAAMYFTYIIVNRHFGLTKPLEVFVILIFICIVDRSFPLGGWGGVLPTAAGIPAMFTRVMALMAIYLMLENKIWQSSLMVTAIISLHIPGDFILVPILFFFIIFNKKTPNKKLITLAFPILFLAYRSLTSDLEIPSGSGAEIANIHEIVTHMAGTDGDFLRHSTLNTVLFLASFILSIAFWRRFRNVDPAYPNMLPFLKAVYISTILLVIGATIYTTVGYKLYFYPPLILLNPVRAMNFYSLFFILSAFVFTLQTPRLTSLEKASILMALAMLHGHSLGGVLYPTIILIVGFSVSHFTGEKLSWLKGRKALVPLSLAMLIAVTGARTATGTVYYTSFDLLTWEHMGRWRIGLKGTDENVWKVYHKIRDMDANFTLLPFYKSTDGKLKNSPYLNIIADKPLFKSDPHFFYLNDELFEENKLRMKALKEVLSSLRNHHPLDEWAIKLLQSRSVTIVAPTADSISLTGWVEQTAINNYTMLRYSTQP